MLCRRRDFLKQSLFASTYTCLVGIGWLIATDSEAAWVSEYFAPAPLSETLKKVYPLGELTDSEAISLKLPRTAENGAVVPVSVSTTLPNVSNITLFVAKNPTPLTVTFDLAPSMDPFVSARIKMAETCNVIAVVNSNGQLFKTKQEVIVTIGGCGG